MICVDNISKSYKNVKALRNFSFDFEHGIYAILGPNGSGKSTLMNIMTGNLSQDSGQIVFEPSKSTKSQTLEDIKIGYVPQYPGMYPHFTVYEMLDYTAILNKAENRHEQIEELLSAFELIEYADKSIKALSGGTKQRLAIAQAFIGQPQLVILDEPTAGLDPLQRIFFKNFISETRRNITIIISTHIVSDVENVADKVLFLKKGELVRAGDVNDILGKLRGKCWSVLDKNVVPEGVLSRVNGHETIIISSEKPCCNATLTDPTLDDCYLSIFGAEK